MKKCMKKGHAAARGGISKKNDDACEAERRHHTLLRSHHQMAKNWVRSPAGACGRSARTVGLKEISLDKKSQTHTPDLGGWRRRGVWEEDVLFAH